ncbi:MAG: nucleotide exchange factor GrpE [bacterium]|nr:nucleotide exchange factor GrpE [bacterium]
MTDEQKDDDVILNEAERSEESPDQSVIATRLGGEESLNVGEQQKSKKGFFHKQSCKDCEKHTQEADEHKTNWQRALADYKNLQRETSERRAEWAQMSERQILEEFIPVYDNFKKAFAVSLPLGEGETKRGSDVWENWKNGIGYIMKQFGEVLKAHNVEEIKTVGEKFDPRFHETVAEEEADQVPGTILREVDGGYKMGERVIKAAKVIISKS